MASGETCCGGSGGTLLGDLAQFPLVKQSLAEFCRVTGLTAKLVPAAAPATPIRFGAQENEFCRRVNALSGGCPACYKTQLKLFRRVDLKLKPQQCSCLAGMVHLAVPVVVAGRHVATVIGGKVRVRPVGAAQFAALARQLRQWGLSGAEVRRLRPAYFRAPLKTREEVRAAARLLDVLARLLAEVMRRYPASRSATDPPCLAEAKQFVRLHLDERFTTRQVAGAMHLSESYFCRLFRRLSGMTFHAYVAQMRVETVKTALLNTHQSISDIAMAAGFQSIPDFNRVFKAKVRMTPSAFRQKHRVRSCEI